MDIAVNANSHKWVKFIVIQEVFITVSRLNNTKYTKKPLKSAWMAAAMATVSVFIAGDGGGFHGRHVHRGRGRCVHRGRGRCVHRGRGHRGRGRRVHRGRRGHGRRGHSRRGHGHCDRGRHWWWPP